MSKTRKFWCLLWHTFWLLVLKTGFCKRHTTLVYVPSNFKIFYHYLGSLTYEVWELAGQLAYKVYYTRNQILFYLLQIKPRQKHSKLPKCYHQVCLKKKNNLHFRSLITIQISQQSPILTQKKNKKNNKKKLAPTAVERFLIAIFDLKELYEIVPTKNLNLKLFWNFVYIFIKHLTKAWKLLKMSRY